VRFECNGQNSTPYDTVMITSVPAGPQDKQRISNYVVSASQAQSAVEDLIKGLVTFATPSAIENVHIKACMAKLGVNNLPGEQCIHALNHCTALRM
jgi:hypothetical protein